MAFVNVTGEINMTKATPVKSSSARIRPSMKKDPIKASDFNAYNIPFACEDCSHFASKDERCTLGFNTEYHLRRNALHSYELSGKIAQCRFLEID
jgi:hypothetical protein